MKSPFNCRYLGLILLSLMLLGCSGAIPQTRVDSTNDARLLGAQLVLHEPLSFAPDQVSRYIQQGELRPSLTKVAVYQPYCKFELWTREPMARVIEPDRFIIKRVVRDNFLVQGPEPLRIAPLRRVSADWASTIELDYTQLYLHSAKQPGVYRMTCEHWNDVSKAVYLTPAQISSTLGKRFSLELNTAP